MIHGRAELLDGQVHATPTVITLAGCGEANGIAAFGHEGRRSKSSCRRSTSSLGSSLLAVTPFIKMMYTAIILIKEAKGER